MAETENTRVQDVQDENHIIAERREKLAKIREVRQAYPNDFVRTDLFKSTAT